MGTRPNIIVPEVYPQDSQVEQEVWTRSTCASRKVIFQVIIIVCRLSMYKQQAAFVALVYALDSPLAMQ